MSQSVSSLPLYPVTIVSPWQVDFDDPFVAMAAMLDGTDRSSGVSLPLSLSVSLSLSLSLAVSVSVTLSFGLHISARLRLTLVSRCLGVTVSYRLSSEASWEASSQGSTSERPKLVEAQKVCVALRLCLPLPLRRPVWLSAPLHHPLHAVSLCRCDADHRVRGAH